MEGIVLSNEDTKLIEELKEEVMELQERLFACQHQNFLLESKLNKKRIEK